MTIDLRISRLGPDPPRASEFYTSIGRIVVAWGRYENQFDWALRSIMQLPDSKPVRPKHAELIPRAFSKKCELWRRAFNKVPSLAPVRDHALKVIEVAVGAFERRTNVVHGFFQTFISADPPVMSGIMIEHKGRDIFAHTFDVGPDQANQLCTTITMLSLGMEPILDHLAALKPPPAKSSRP